jgi:hypothetical protein
MEEIRFSADGRARWAGMADFRLVSPDGEHQLEIQYVGEPPHGDSYHRMSIYGRAFPGHSWGCMFAFSPCSRYVGFSWMPAQYDRRTVVADMNEFRFSVSPEYMYDFGISWPAVVSEGPATPRTHVFDGSESWAAY